MQQRGSGGATTWAVGAAAWVCFLTGGCGVFFFFFGVDSRLWVIGGGGGVRCVQCSDGGDYGFLNKKKERERINNVLYCK